MIQLSGRQYKVVQASIYGLTLESRDGHHTVSWSWEVVRHRYPDLAREYGR